MEAIDFMAFLCSKIKTNKDIIEELESEIEEYKKSGLKGGIIDIDKKDISRLSLENKIIKFVGDYIIKVLKEDGMEMDFSTDYYSNAKKYFYNLLKTHNANEDTIEC